MLNFRKSKEEACVVEITQITNDYLHIMFYSGAKMLL